MRLENIINIHEAGFDDYKIDCNRLYAISFGSNGARRFIDCKFDSVKKIITLRITFPLLRPRAKVNFRSKHKIISAQCGLNMIDASFMENITFDNYESIEDISKTFLEAYEKMTIYGESYTNTLMNELEKPSILKISKSDSLAFKCKLNHKGFYQGLSRGTNNVVRKLSVQVTSLTSKNTKIDMSLKFDKTDKKTAYLTHILFRNVLVFEKSMNVNVEIEDLSKTLFENLTLYAQAMMDKSFSKKNKENI